jgi:hypothetical protein
MENSGDMTKKRRRGGMKKRLRTMYQYKRHNFMKNNIFSFLSGDRLYCPTPTMLISQECLLDNLDNSLIVGGHSRSVVGGVPVSYFNGGYEYIGINLRDHVKPNTPISNVNVHLIRGQKILIFGHHHEIENNETFQTTKDNKKIRPTVNFVTFGDSSRISSPYVLLLSVTTIKYSSTNVFHPADLAVIRKSKKSFVKSDGSVHFKSTGEIFAFGEAASYAKITVNNPVSIARYRNSK